MTLSLIIGLILFGVLLIMIEIFITPGFIVGVLGTLFLAVGIAYTYKEYGDFSGNITLAATAVFLATTLTLAFRNGAWNRFAITDAIDGKANNIDQLIINVGDTGKSISALRPAGSAIINDQRLEVHADGEFILANEEIEVIKKVQNQIFIKKINT
jgi:membrane-bound ClpP family serine protease